MSTGVAYSVANNSGSYGSRVVMSNAVFTCTGISVNGIAASLQLLSGTLDVSRPSPLTTNLSVGVSVSTNTTISFRSGTLSTGAMNYQAGANNGLEFVVGDGTNPAYYDMTANGSGYHSFSSFGSPDFVVTNGAYLRGSGTLKGTTRVFGTFVPGFAGTAGSVVTSNSLTFSGSAVLNYDLGAVSDTATINGNLALGNSTLNVGSLTGFGATTYVLFQHTNTVTTPSGTLTVVSMPPGFTGTVSNDLPNAQVLLVVTAIGGGDPYATWTNFYGLGGASADGGADPDGDGMSNTNEFLAGFNPTNNAAYLHVISVVKSGIDMNITYLGANGDSSWSPGVASRTNVLEFTAGTANGSYSNNFTSTGVSQVLSNGTGLGVVTNMVDVGGATNVPSRYYRVRVLVP